MKGNKKFIKNKKGYKKEKKNILNKKMINNIILKSWSVYY